MKLICLGDSTMQYNSEETFPQCGWPQGLGNKIKNVDLINLAINGKSTKSFIEEKNFENAIKVVDQDSIVLIEFGHNDEHEHQPERFTRPDIEYRENLIYMVSECKKKGAYVILLTPIQRRHFLDDGSIDKDCHKGYREAMIKVAEDTKTDLIDMTLLTRDLIESLGVEDSKKMFMIFDKDTYPNYPEGKIDNTHLRQYGADSIASLFVEQVKNNEKFKEILNV